MSSQLGINQIGLPFPLFPKADAQMFSLRFSDPALKTQGRYALATPESAKLRE